MLVAAPVGPPQHLLDDDAAEVMGNKKEGSDGIFSPQRLQGTEEVPRDISDRGADGRCTIPVLGIGIISVCQDTGMRYISREKVPGPIHRRWCAMFVLSKLGEHIESTGLDTGLR